MDFDLPEELQMLQEVARDFARAELAPRAKDSDQSETFVEEQVRLCAEQGWKASDLEATLGNGIIQYHSAEEPLRVHARRGLYAARDLPSGTVLTEDAVRALRPCVHLGAERLAEFLGRTLKQDLPAGTPLEEGMFSP